jgi:hypothetical protein
LLTHPHATLGEVDIAPGQATELRFPHAGIKRERVERGRPRARRFRDCEKRRRFIGRPAMHDRVGVAVRRMGLAGDELRHVPRHELRARCGVQGAVQDVVVLRQGRRAEARHGLRRVVPLEVQRFERLEANRSEHRLEVQRNHAAINVIRAGRPHRGLDGLLYPLREPRADRLLTRGDERAVVRIGEEGIQTGLGVALAAAHRDPLLPALAFTGRRILRIAQIENQRPTAARISRAESRRGAAGRTSLIAQFARTPETPPASGIRGARRPGASR